jgi:hypothetical protein
MGMGMGFKKTGWRHMRRHEEHIYCFVGADSCRGRVDAMKKGGKKRKTNIRKNGTKV